MITDKIRQEVARGADQIETIIPDWRQRINRKTLDIYSTENCVLCQVFGGFIEGLMAVGGPINGERGFACLSGESEAYTAAWLEMVDAPKEV